MTDYKKNTVKQLREMLKERKIPSTGLTKKDQIIAKLQEYDVRAAAATAEPPPTEPIPTEPAPAEPASIEPTPTEPTTAEPPPDESTTTEPPPAEHTTIELPQAEPATEGPLPAEPIAIEPPPAESAPTEPSPVNTTTIEAPAAETTPIELPSAEAATIELPLAEPTAIEPPSLADTDVVEDNNKRKRRSPTPPVADEDVAIKKARHETDGVRLKEDAEFGGNGGDAIEKNDATVTDTVEAVEQPQQPPIEPAMHRPTKALYISNLVRPLQQTVLQQHLETLAKGPLSLLHVDPRKSHAFAVFDSESTATEVRTALHSRIWPEKDTWREPLRVDYIPEVKAQEWADEEKEADPNGSKNLPWVVEYKTNAFSHVTALHVNATNQSFGRAGAGEPSKQQTATEKTDQTPIKTLDELFLHTVDTKPKIYYKEVADERQEVRRRAFQNHTDQHRARKVVFRFDEYDRLRVSEPGGGSGRRGRGGFGGGRRG